MKKTIAICLVLLSISAFAEEAFEVSVSYNRGEFLVSKIERIDVGYIPTRNIDEAVYMEKYAHDSAYDYYSFVLRSDSDELYSFHVRYPPLIHYDYIDDQNNTRGGVIELNESDENFIIPYFEEAAVFEIADCGGRVVESVGLSDFMPGFESSGKVGIEGANNKPAENKATEVEISDTISWIAIVLILLLVLLLVFRRD